MAEFYQAGHGAVNDKTSSLGVLQSLLLLKLLDNLQKLLVIIVFSFEARGPTQGTVNAELFYISISVSAVTLSEINPKTFRELENKTYFLCFYKIEYM